MSLVIVNIGSNVGNRRLHLSRAVKRLGDEFGPFELSHTVESEPWGFDSTNSFLNVAMMFQSDLSPVEIMNKLQGIERSISTLNHRNSDGSYRDREIDIDIMAIDEIVIEDPLVTLPHPRLPERDFFLVPFQELAPSWRHPVNGKTAGEMLSELQQKKDE